MPFRLSAAAAVDVDRIIEYTLLNFGSEQAEKYAASLEHSFALIAEMPMLGRKYEPRPELHQFPHGRHVIFYKIVSEDILIVRILHERMNPDWHI